MREPTSSVHFLLLCVSMFVFILLLLTFRASGNHVCAPECRSQAFVDALKKQGVEFNCTAMVLHGKLNIIFFFS